MGISSPEDVESNYTKKIYPCRKTVYPSRKAVEEETHLKSFVRVSAKTDGDDKYIILSILIDIARARRNLTFFNCVLTRGSPAHARLVASLRLANRHESDSQLRDLSDDG